jgi:hypothetical protein
MDALVSLGLTPAFLGWGWDTLEKQWQLLLVTSVVDAGGPLALNRLLFRAYNAKATPQQISPFIVRVVSPELIPGGAKSQFWWLGEKMVNLRIVPDKSNPAAGSTEISGFQQTFMGLELEMKNCYKTLPGAVERALAGYHARYQEWQRFRRRVEALAA